MTHTLPPSMGELVDGCCELGRSDVPDDGIDLGAQVISIGKAPTPQLAFDSVEKPVVTRSQIGTVPRMQDLCSMVSAQVVLDEMGVVCGGVVLLEMPILSCPPCWTPAAHSFTQLPQVTQVNMGGDTLALLDELTKHNTLTVPKDRHHDFHRRALQPGDVWAVPSRGQSTHNLLGARQGHRQRTMTHPW